MNIVLIGSRPENEWNENDKEKAKQTQLTGENVCACMFFINDHTDLSVAKRRKNNQPNTHFTIGHVFYSIIVIAFVPIEFDFDAKSTFSLVERSALEREKRERERKREKNNEKTE